MQQEQQQQRGWTPVRDAQDAATVLMVIASALAAPVEPILRSHFGCRYFGMHAFLGFLAVPMWMLFWPGENPGPLITFWALSIAMQLVARTQSRRMMIRGDIVHTRYNGYPRFAKLFKRMPQEKIKSNAEPCLVIAVGAALLPVSKPLGSFLIASGFSLSVVASVIEGVERRRALSAHDAWLETQDHSARFHELRGRRR